MGSRRGPKRQKFTDHRLWILNIPKPLFRFLDREGRRRGLKRGPCALQLLMEQMAKRVTGEPE